jgi:hypothetical protein
MTRGVLQVKPSKSVEAIHGHTIGEMRKPKRPELINKFPAIVRPDFMIQGISVRPLFIGRAKQRNRDGPAHQDLIGQANRGKQSRAERVDMSGAPGFGAAQLFDGNGTAASIAGEQQALLLGITMFAIHDAFRFIEGEGCTVVGQIAEGGIGGAGENNLPKVRHFAIHQQVLRLAAALVAVRPEVADHREGSEEVGGDDAAHRQLAHQFLTRQRPLEIHEVVHDIHHLQEDLDRIGSFPTAISHHASS